MAMKTAKNASVCFVCFVLAFSQNAAADFVQATSPAGFFEAGNTLDETFNETITLPNPNAIDGNGNKPGSLVFVGTSESYTFSNTGATLTWPDPNTPGAYNPNVAVINSKQLYGFGSSYGQLLPNSGLIPGGTGACFLSETGESSTHFLPFVLTFPSDGAYMVGGDFAMLGNTPGTDKIIVTAYDSSGGLLGTASILACDASDWANNFLGVECQSSNGTFTPIKSIGIDYSTNNDAGNPTVANLMFSPILAGDANMDGQVDINDLTIVLANYNQTGMNWSQGDFNNDGQVDINDLTIVLANYNTSDGSVGLKAVPEPSCLVLLGVVIIGLLGYAWRRRKRNS
jgi:hypothetical protein